MSLAFEVLVKENIVFLNKQSSLFIKRQQISNFIRKKKIFSWKLSYSNSQYVFVFTFIQTSEPDTW